ncbi:MAG: hypothetical protein JSR33_12170, partial [Proteobacteria bacterium]|nr:hypothetical protein [Pseudomonadota bacterium]
EQIRDILKRVDLDPEAHLARYVGDVAAHEITWRTKKLVAMGKRSWRGLLENVREYSQEEVQLLPSRDQAEEFYSRLAVLRDDVERAQQRIFRLEFKLSQREDRKNDSKQ